MFLASNSLTSGDSYRKDIGTLERDKKLKPIGRRKV
jgi:hypothetical protein